MIGPAAVRRVAGATGFREEVVEKVLYLTAILGRLRTHPSLQNAWNRGPGRFVGVNVYSPSEPVSP
jgi:hypothetical protein